MKWLIILLFLISCAERESKPESIGNSDTTITASFKNSSPFPTGLSDEELYTKYNLRTSDSLSECEYMLYDYFPYWMRDSVGANGFRMVYADKMLRDCLLNQKWIKVEKYLGKPFSIFTYDDGVTNYQFLLSYFLPGEQSAPGNLFLLISVENGIITFCKIHTIDG